MFNERSKTTPRTEAQTIASRENGSKSNGPVSPEGKQNASGNRRTHGFRSRNIALCNERTAQYTAHLDAYLARYSPIDKVESDLVGLLAANMWQVMRMNSVEVALFDLEICDTAAQVSEEYDIFDEWLHLAVVFKKQAGDNALELLRRYKSTAERAYHRALEAIEKLQKGRPRTTALGKPAAEVPPEEIAVGTRESTKVVETETVTPSSQPLEPVAIDTHPMFAPAGEAPKPARIGTAPDKAPTIGSENEPAPGPGRIHTRQDK